jgi:phage tail-like protein
MADALTDMLPFTTFNFQILIAVDGIAGNVCKAEFSDCDGLEMSMTPKTLREGGSNTRQIHLAGPISFGQLTLKRGMTQDDGLWRWFELLRTAPWQRGQAVVGVLSPDRSRVDVRFVLTNCLPVKLKAPALSGKDGQVAIEELQLAYECLARQA